MCFREIQSREVVPGKDVFQGASQTGCDPEKLFLGKDVFHDVPQNTNSREDAFIIDEFCVQWPEFKRDAFIQ